MTDQVTEAVFAHLRGIAKKSLTLLNDLPARRKLIDRYFQLDGEAPPVLGQAHRISINGMAAEWVTAPGAKPDKRVLYIHGGSWVSGSLEGYRSLASQISAAAKAAVLVIDYRLAPENPFPAGLNDCVAAFAWMRENGPQGPGAAAKAAICGDSAGGNLTLACWLALKQQGKPGPDALVAFSPATDFTGQSESLKSHAGRDPIIHHMVYEVIPQIYLGEHERRDPLASPVFGDWQGAPPTLIQVGSEEVLLDDARRMAGKIMLDGGDAELQVYDGMPHVFQGFAPKLGSAAEALHSAGQFLRQAFT
ncbi:alpha/beta hydrolase [Granulosicoccaceae sp. 1_MG-2023]|nr:alpha/beta hydrolase [Granulosicoccaceae sp. 1_MG-2023]